MPKKKAKPIETDTEPQARAVDVRRLRAETLAGVLHLAKKVLTPKSKLVSLHVSCSQYFADEAGDAVHSSMVASKAMFPAR